MHACDPQTQEDQKYTTSLRQARLYDISKKKKKNFEGRREEKGISLKTNTRSATLCKVALGIHIRNLSQYRTKIPAQLFIKILFTMSS